MRLDLLLCRLRFVKSRSQAQRWICEGHMRLNGQRAARPDCAIRAGDVLTLPVGHAVRVVAIDALPERRGPPAEARAHYRELDARNPAAIAGASETRGPATP